MNLNIFKAMSQRLVKLSFLLLFINGIVTLIGTVLLYWTLSQYTTEVQWIDQAKKQQILSEKLSKTVLLIQSQLKIHPFNNYLIELEDILESWPTVDWSAKTNQQNNNADWQKFTQLQHHEQTLITLTRQLFDQLTTKTPNGEQSAQLQNDLITFISPLLHEQTIWAQKHQILLSQTERQIQKRSHQLANFLWYFAIALLFLFSLEAIYFIPPSVRFLQQHLIKLINQNNELAEKNSWFKTLLDNTSATICIKDLQNRHLFVNQYEKTFQLKREEISSKTDDEISSPMTFARPQHDELKKLAGEIVWEIQEEIFQNNELQIYQTIKIPLYDRNGESVAIGEISSDITQHKQAEKVLQEQEAMLHALLEANPEFACLIDHQGTVLRANQMTAQRLNTSKEQLINRCIYEFLPPNLAKSYRQQVDKVLHHHLANHFQYHHGDNYFDHYLFPVLHEKEQSAQIIMIQIDITQDKQAQIKNNQLNQQLEQKVAQHLHQIEITNQALTTEIASHQQMENAWRSTEQRCRSMIETAQEGIWVTDTQANITFVNQQMANMLGYRTQEMIGKAIFEFGLQTLNFNHANTSCELPLSRKDGSLLWVNINTNPQHDEQSQFIGTLIMMTDITRRKQAEIAQQETLNLLQQVLSSLNDAVLVIDFESYTIEQCNQTTEVIFGYQPRQLSGQSFEILHLDQNHFASFICEVKRSLQRDQNENSKLSKSFDTNLAKTNNFFITVCEMKRQNGQVFTTELFISPLKYQENQVVKIVTVIKDITERQQIEAVIDETEHKFRLLTETVASAIVIYQDDKFIYANPAATAITGYSRAELLRKRFWEIVHPDFQTTIKENGLAGQRGEEVPTRYEIKIVTKENEIKWIDVMACLMNYQGKRVTLATAFDITERKEAEETLYHVIEGISATTGNNFLQKLVEYLSKRLQVKYSLIGQLINEKNLLQTLFVVENNQLIDNFAHEITNTPCENMLQGQFPCCSYPENLSQIFPDTPWLTSKNIESFIGTPLFNSRGKVMGLMAVMDSKPLLHQTQIEFILQIFAARASAELERVQALDALDKERLSLAKRVEERTVELTAANAELARAAKLKDEFLANMSHELRTPLNAILGMSEVLQEGAYGTVNERQAQSLRTIEESGRHLLTLINDILDLAKIEAGKVKLEMSPVMVEYLGKNCLRLVQQLAHKKNIKTHFIFDQEIKLILVDERCLKQILLNLLSNAIKFTSAQGKVTLEILGDVEQEIIHFMVSDTGIGIAMEQVQDKLFKPFIQLDSGLNRHHEGTGLGLSLVYRLAELHGGSVSVTSELGKGSCFTVSLPWQSVNEENQTNLDFNLESATDFFENENVSNNFDLTEQSESVEVKATILLVDDNPIICQTVSDYLTIKGYSIVIAHNGIQALEKTKELHPDLILMDIQMPTMDGLEAIRQLRADEQMKEVPIIALTALAMPGDKQRCLQAGANEYLSKPVSFKQLISSIKKLLN
jgi:PAS domain S-box-containing protein